MPHILSKSTVAESSCQKASDKTIAFYVPHSIYINMHQSPFVADNKYYRTSEHYIQTKKADLFDDDVQVVKILNANSPIEAKRLGGRVCIFNFDKWSKNATDIAIQGVFEKVRGNENICKVPSSLADNVKIVETNSDYMLGTEISLSNDHALYKQN